MQLSDYLRINGISFAAFARAIGTPHARTVERYAKGQAIPNRAMMPKVIAETGGAVTADDFFAILPADVARAASE